MEYYFLKGFLVVLSIQHCTSKDPSTSIQFSKVVTFQDGLTSHREQELELPSAEVVPVVAPPTLKEVQQAVQEASEQVEGRGAEEVLKELLERVVEAALGQVDSEVKAGEGAAHEVVKENTQSSEKEEAKTDTDVQGLKKGSEGEDTIIKGGHTGAGEEHGVAEVDAFQDVAKEGKGITQSEEKTAAGSVVEATVGVETGGKEADGVEVINESLDTDFSQGVAEATLIALDETGVEEAVMEDSNKQDVLSKEAAETGTRSAEETPAIGEVAEDKTTQEDTVEQSDPSLAVSDEEQLAGVLEREGALEEKTLVDELESEATVLASDNFATESTQSAAEEEEEEEEIVKETKGPEVEDEQSQLPVEGGAAEEVEAEGTNVEEAEGGEKDGEREKTDESMALVNEKSEEQVGEEEQVTLEKSHGTETESQETLVIPAPEPEDGGEASKEQNPLNPTPTPRSSLGGVKTEDNTLGDEKSKHGNEIITPTDDLSPHNPVVAQPTLDNVVTDVQAGAPQAGENELVEAIELVDDTTGTTETRELGLEAWKIGAIFAAVFLVLETAVIFIYILKCHNRNSAQVTERTCEEGCVEPEAATGGDCSNDTLSAGNGGTQQIPPLDMVSSLAQNKEQHEESHVITMSDLVPSSREESDNIGPGPHSLQELRTSNL